MNTKTDEGLYEKARKLFISKASIDEFAGWATPRQVDAVHRLLDTELANRERTPRRTTCCWAGAGRSRSRSGESTPTTRSEERRVGKEC